MDQLISITTMARYNEIKNIKRDKDIIEMK